MTKGVLATVNPNKASRLLNNCTLLPKPSLQTSASEVASRLFSRFSLFFLPEFWAKLDRMSQDARQQQRRERRLSLFRSRFSSTPKAKALPCLPMQQWPGVPRIPNGPSGSPSRQPLLPKSEPSRNPCCLSFFRNYPVIWGRWHGTKGLHGPASKASGRSAAFP